MKIKTIAWIAALGSTLIASSALAYDCSGLPEWKRQTYYLVGAQVQYQGIAYENTEEPSKRDRPDAGYPWSDLGTCEASGGGGGGGDVDPQPLTIYGVWHCSNDYCTWASPRSTATGTDFDTANHWIIDRGDGKPSVNLVVLSFVHPLKLLEGTTDQLTVNGVPRGMSQEVVDYFKSKGIRVMLSIGGITYTDAWNQALAADAWQLGLNAAEVASSLGVGIEIDYEENTNPNLDSLEKFVAAYRSVHPYDASGADPAARLTIDLAAGDRWLISLTEHATRVWLNADDPVLDYANAMVTARPVSADKAIANWQEHIDGKPQYNPAIPPLAPARLVGSLWLTGRKPAPECVDFSRSLQYPTATGQYVQTVQPNGAGTTAGMLGYMFWAAECEGTHSMCTTPPNDCQGGMGDAAAYYDIAVPMKPLRQK